MWFTKIYATTTNFVPRFNYNSEKIIVFKLKVLAFTKIGTLSVHVSAHGEYAVFHTEQIWA